MQDLDDMALLRHYTEQNSEEAFAVLVERHVNKVYSVALRHTGSSHQAEEITQAVFVILARKSGQLRPGVMLSGWLYQTARYTAVTFIRGEIRRARREQEAQMQTTPNENESSDAWTQIAPWLDAALAGLNEMDRQAVLLRFFDGKSLREVGAALGASEDAAKMRVNRSVEKLRRFFSKRGVVLSAAVLTAAIAANSVQAAPVLLAKTTTAVAVAKGATASGSTSTLIKGALKLMAWTKAKTAVIVGVGLLLAAGTAEVAVKQINYFRISDGLWKQISREALEKAPETVVVRPTHFGGVRQVPGKTSIIGLNIETGQMIGKDHDFRALITAAYDASRTNYGELRTVFPAALPQGHFDFLATVREHPEQRLQAEIKRQFGFVARPQLVETNVFLLRLKNPALIESRVVPQPWTLATLNETRPFSAVVREWENVLQTPIVDETELTNRYDVSPVWPPNGHPAPGQREADREAFRKTVLDQLGLELVPGREAVEMLVVEKVR
jgi:uncharacterized protein (TIGR03435 family)